MTDDIKALRTAADMQGLSQEFHALLAEIERLRAERDALNLQRDSLRDALAKVLDAADRYAKATMSYQNARENFSDGGAKERKAHERAMLAASDAEREARVLLLTLKDTK